MTKKRKYASAEQKAEILKRHFLDGEDISKLCDEFKLHVSTFYLWQKEFFENGARAFNSDGQKEQSRLKSEVDQLTAKLQKKDTVLAELMEEHVALKKSLGET